MATLLGGERWNTEPTPLDDDWYAYKTEQAQKEDPLAIDYVPEKHRELNELAGDVKRLMEVLKEDPCDSIEHSSSSCKGCPYECFLNITHPNEYSINVSGSCFEVRYAEYLLKKGVVLPPVDIGDKVWYIDGGYYNAAFMKPKEITVTEINKKRVGKTIDWGFIANNTRYKFSSFGKTVFWTKEDCEAAIAKKKKSSKKFT